MTAFKCWEFALTEVVHSNSILNCVIINLEYIVYLHTVFCIP
jgi:hypothetical protein